MTGIVSTLLHPGERVTWSRVEPGFHVASRSGEFVGFAERTGDGKVVGFDGRSTPVGIYPSLASARRAVEEAGTSRGGGGDDRVEKNLYIAATVSGIIAIVTFVSAVITLSGI